MQRNHFATKGPIKDEFKFILESEAEKIWMQVVLVISTLIAAQFM